MIMQLREHNECKIYNIGMKVEIVIISLQLREKKISSRDPWGPLVPVL